MRWVVHVTCMGDWDSCIQGVAGETCREKTTWRNNNIKMDLKEINLLYEVRCVNNITKTHSHAFVYFPNSLYIRKCSNVSIFRCTVCDTVSTLLCALVQLV